MVNMPQNNNLFMKIYQSMFNGNGLKQEAIDAEILYNTALWGERPHGLFVTLTLRGSDGKEYTT